MSDKNAVIRYRFGLPDTKVYGAGLIVLEPGASQTSGFTLAVSDDPNIGSIDLGTDPEKFSETLRSASGKNAGTHLASLERDCVAVLKAELKNVIGPYHKAIASGSDEKLRTMTTSLLKKPVQAAGFIVGHSKFNVELTLKQNGTAGAEEPESPPDPTSALPRIEIDPILSPISGVSAVKLSVGQDIYVTLADDTHYQSHFGRSREDGAQILGQLGRMEINDKSEATLIIILKPNLAGVCTVPSDAKLKTPADKKSTPTPSGAKAGKSGGFPVTALLVIGSLVLLILIYFLI